MQDLLDLESFPATLQVLQRGSSLLGEGDSNMQFLIDRRLGSLGGELFVWRWHLLAGSLV